MLPDDPSSHPASSSSSTIPPTSSSNRRLSRFRIKQRLATWHHPHLDQQDSLAAEDHADQASVNRDNMPSLKSPAHPGGNINQKLRNFFRINTHNGVSDKEKVSDSTIKHDSKSGLRQPKRFFTTVGRLRSTTTASEGNPLDDVVMSPTASANPYFAHQGQPGLRHHDTGSVPPSPPDTPSLRIDGPDGTKEHATNATKEELARKLRRVASAPNAQGLFNQGRADGERPATAELGKEPLVQSGNASSLGLVDSKPNSLPDARTLSVPDRDGLDELGALPPPGHNTLAFRRTYSANSIKVRTVEVGPSSFDKIKLIGKGDVGKVYLVREKKSARLYAMKG
jgi:protein-serine/threonine kinase